MRGAVCMRDDIARELRDVDWVGGRRAPGAPGCSPATRASPPTAAPAQWTLDSSNWERAQGLLPVPSCTMPCSAGRATCSLSAARSIGTGRATDCRRRSPLSTVPAAPPRAGRHSGVPGTRARRSPCRRGACGHTNGLHVDTPTTILGPSRVPQGGQFRPPLVKFDLRSMGPSDRLRQCAGPLIGL